MRFLLLSELFYNSSYNKSNPVRIHQPGSVDLRQLGEWVIRLEYSSAMLLPAQDVFDHTFAFPSRHDAFAENSHDRRKHESAGVITTTGIS